jgi:malonate decarboxylase alpha subunit
MVQSGVVLPEHLDAFERGVAKRLDYAYSGPQSSRIAGMLFGGKIELGAVHTYLELFARYFVDLTRGLPGRLRRGGSQRLPRIRTRRSAQ